MKCDCGIFVTKLRYKGSKRICENCQPTNLSGVWERNNDQERRKYTKDILQVGQPGFKEVYGEPRNNTTKGRT